MTLFSSSTPSEDTSDKSYYIGVDVGTGSARAALVDVDGNILSESSYATTTFRSDADARIFEQSTLEIWDCISRAVKDVVRDAKVAPKQVKGIGMDATCSLAVTDEQGRPMSVTPEPEGKWGESKRNVILWADHRAEEEARDINATGSMVLNYVGKTMSLEMEIPKVLWLKKHMPAEVFSKCMFFDLPDYLTYRATDCVARSNCSLVCKCSYVPPGVDGSKDGWQADFFNQIGLGDMVKNDFEQLGGIPGKNGLVLTAGQPVGLGLSEAAAKDFGLEKGTPVGSALIDAYAGWVGTVAASSTNDPDAKKPDLLSSRNRLAAIAGTSTCHCIQSPDGVLVNGVWGPYKHAVFPGMWMNEGGQSSTGQLIDFIINTHPAAEKVKAQAKEKKQNIFVYLQDQLEELQKAQGVSSLSHLTRDFYIYPDFHGNRSPLADSGMRGMITGQRLDSGTTDLALRYFATLEAIALQTRHIVDEMNSKGHEIDSIYMSGGQVKNATFMQLIADTCAMPVQLPFSDSASVVAGSAILGRFAADSAHPETATGDKKPKEAAVITTQEDAERFSFANKDHLWDLMVRMTKPGTFVFPTKDTKMKKLLDAKYEIFRDAIEVQRRWRKKVADAIDE